MKLSCQILLGLLIVTAASCHPTWNLLTDQDPKRPASTYVRLRLAPVSVPEGPWSRRCAASGGIQLRAKTARATRTVWMSGVFQLEPGPRRLELTFKATSYETGKPQTISAARSVTLPELNLLAGHQYYICANWGSGQWTPQVWDLGAGDLIYTP